jgi:hypothetical protein
VPFEDGEQTFVARFDPESGMLDLLEAMRYKGNEDQAKTLWIPKILEWDVVNGNPTMSKTSITWFDEGTPWVVFNVEEIVLNVDVGEYIRARGK